MKSFLLLPITLFLFANHAITQTFNSTGSSTIVDNSAETCNNITVSGLASSINGTFGITSVCVTLSSACMKDIDMFLVAPDGTRINLTTDNGNNSDGFNNLCFKMNATTNGSISNIPGNNGLIHTGDWIPEGNIYDVNNGQNPNGTWKLCVADDKSGGGCNTNGTLTSWSINFGAPPARAVSVQDCNGAIPVCQNTYSETNTYPGQGYVSGEISASGNCLGEGEKNSVWYVFTVETSGNLGFQITPKSALSTFDYDFAMYNITTNGCDGITATDGDPVSPQVSCNYSTVGGSTGTSAAGTGNNQNALGTNQNTLIPVTAGQTYAFQVSNFTGGGSGYDLNFNAAGNTASIVDVTPPTYNAIVGTVICGASTITFSTSEPIRCSSLFGNEFTVTGPSYSSSGTTTGAGCPGTTNLLTIALSTPLPTNTNGPFNITVGAGSDGGTISDNCGNSQPVGQTISFNTSCPLPVQLIDFRAQIINYERVKINWDTKLEENNDYFTLEKSNSGHDFVEIARLDAIKDNSPIKRYTYYDEDVSKGTSYYRLKQTDYDGKSMYHSIVSVYYENPLNIVVNQLQSTVTVTYTSDLSENSVLQFYDITGKIIHSEFIDKSIENKKSEIDTKGLNKGIYFLRIQNNKQNINYKVKL